jgi:glucose/mannose-6-phosphate isomerase
LRKEISKSVIFKQINGIPEQIEVALASPIGKIRKSKRVCICGMGASALAGDVISDYVDESSDTSVYVVRGIELPGWVDNITTVIAMSYSGNTKEVLLAYEDARSRGSNIICITSGGELKRRCGINKNTLVEVPSGLVSRGAFGFLLGYLAVVLSDMGICKAAEDLDTLIPKLKKHRDDLIRPENKQVEDIASMLLNRIPVIYGLANMRSSAIRWKTQINENSKSISFYGSLPEFNHNEIVGWTVDKKNTMFMPVILYDDDASDVIRQMIDTSIDILQDEELKLVAYHVSGSNNLEKNLKCIMLGDFVSLQLAYLCSTDPGTDTAVTNVNSFVIIEDR